MLLALLTAREKQVDPSARGSDVDLGVGSVLTREVVIRFWKHALRTVDPEQVRGEGAQKMHEWMVSEPRHVSPM
jgi:hypothetical protein